MSLRPYMQGFSIDAFQALVGCDDADERARLHRRVDETFVDVAARASAHTWVDRILSGRIEVERPEVEDETLQSVIVLAARLQPVLDNHHWGFWEALLAHAERSFRTAAGARRRVCAWLLFGRPRFTNKIASSWTTCAFIANADIEHLLTLASEEALRAAWERDDAIAWLEHMKREGRDLLWVCN